MRRTWLGWALMTLALYGCAAQSRHTVAGAPSHAATRVTPDAASASTASAPASWTPAPGPASAAATAGPADTIPWLDLPGNHLEPSPLPTVPPTDDAPPCQAAQLAVASVVGPGDTSDDGAIVALRNASRSVCRLTGTVQATLYGPGAPPVMIVGITPPFHWTSHDMRPGDTTSVWFTATRSCMTGPAQGLEAIPVTKARLRIPGGGSVLISGLDIPRTCDSPHVSAFYQRPVDPTYPRAPLEGARIDVLAPAKVEAGTTLRYTVQLSNPTGKDISMQPCPSYHEMLSPYPDKTYRLLNCDGHTALLPHQTLRFAMQLRVPPLETNGPEKLVWALDTPTGGHPPVMVDIVGSTVTMTAPPPLPHPNS